MRSKIRAVELYITAKCDAGCSFCFSRDFTAHGEHVPTDTLLRRAEMVLGLHRASPLARVTLIGGEPLMHRGLAELTRTFGRELPLSIASAGLPKSAVSIDQIVQDVSSWVLTYNQHLLSRFTRLANTLHQAGRQVVTTLHFKDYASFVGVNQDFLRDATEQLVGISDAWRESFLRHTESRTTEDYYGVTFEPFVHGAAEDKAMIVRYTAYDTRFTRPTGDFQLPYLPKGRRFQCHLFHPTRILSITEDGRVMPCSAIGHRHAHPIIENLDTFGRLPENLAQYIEDCQAQLFQFKGTRDCDLQCQRMQWALDA